MRPNKIRSSLEDIPSLPPFSGYKTNGWRWTNRRGWLALKSTKLMATEIFTWHGQMTLQQSALCDFILCLYIIPNKWSTMTWSIISLRYLAVAAYGLQDFFVLYQGLQTYQMSKCTAYKSRHFKCYSCFTRKWVQLSIDCMPTTKRFWFAFHFNRHWKHAQLIQLNEFILFFIHDTE